MNQVLSWAFVSKGLCMCQAHEGVTSAGDADHMQLMLKSIRV